MKETLQNILIENEKNYGLKIRNQNFSNEIIFKKEIFTGILDPVNFSNCQFKTVDLLSNSFLNCTFKRCKFEDVDFGWSYFASCQFLEIRLNEINFEGTIMSDLKAINTTSLNLHFHEKFPMKLWKYNQLIKIKDSSSFDKLSRDNQLD